ncbi:XdhC family protein [Chloroflexota bacterium]
MDDIFKEIVKISAEGGQAALATVISVAGSAPREEGARMLIREDGSILGTIGGGRLEAEVRREAMAIMNEDKARILHFDLTGRESAEEGMICGGVTDIFLEPIITEPTLYIFGGGHISFFIARIAKMTGFKVVVIDDRAEFANRERFPEADEVIARELPTVFKDLKIGKSAYIVIVTRGHLSDEEVLEWAVKTEARYIGMIGSQNKTKTVLSHLRDKGIPESMLKRVYAPIGLDINAETPEEIAVSIMAEVIKVRRSAAEGSPKASHQCQGGAPP